MHRPRNERGASAVEYALIMSLVAAVAAFSIFALGQVMKGEYGQTCKQVATYEGSTC